MPKRTSSYNSWQLEKLTNPETAAAYLNAAISDSPEMFRKALRNVAQSRQMAKVAREAGVTRESLYRATSDIGNPTLETLASIFTVLDLQMTVQPKTSSATVATPVPVVSTTRVTRPIRISRPLASIKRIKKRGFAEASAGAQMAFDFTAAPMPTAVQQSIAESAASTETLLPAYLTSILLERNYGYARAFNASQDNP